MIVIRLLALGTVNSSHADMTESQKYTNFVILTISVRRKNIKKDKKNQNLEMLIFTKEFSHIFPYLVILSLIENSRIVKNRGKVSTSVLYELRKNE